MIKEFQNEYRWLSNFTPVEVELDGLIYSSVEHAYMSAKSDDIKWKRICTNPNYTAGEIKRLSRQVHLIPNWDNIKLNVMEDCIRQKFNQEPYKSKLLQTGNLYIQEGNRWNDKFWGVCLKTNQGQNFLGKLIMKIRDEIQLSNSQ